MQAYGGLHAAAAKGDVAEIERWSRPARRSMRATASPHAAACRRLHAKQDAARALMKLGADPNALEAQHYDIVTIAAVANDCDAQARARRRRQAGNITSPYDGTALIAAAHLGHDEVVRTLIAAKAPLDHVNNLGWTALIEAIVLGDGGKRHIASLEALVEGRRQRQSRRPRRHHAADAGARPRLYGDGEDSRCCRRALISSPAARQRQPDSAADQRQPGHAAEPFRVGAAKEKRASPRRPRSPSRRRTPPPAAPTPRTSPPS